MRPWRHVPNITISRQGKLTDDVRLSKLMAERGMCSRREADRFIQQGLVFVDGVTVVTLGTKIGRNQKITLDRQAHNQQSKLVTVLINKPAGYVSGLPEKGYQSAVMLIDKKRRQNPDEATPRRHGLAPAGRLDIDSTGLIVFTQDGRVAKKLIGPQSVVEKEYLVWVHGEITAAKIQLLQHGLHLDGKALKPALVKKINPAELRFILTEGRKRQIRRMCELVDLKVSRLTRIRIGRIVLGGLKTGKWRLLQSRERF